MLSQLEVEVIHSLQFCVPGVRLRFAVTEAQFPWRASANRFHGGLVSAI